MKWFLCLCLLALLSGSAFGQDGSSIATRTESVSIQDEQIKTEVDRLLNTTTVREHAWAAYYIGKYGLKDYIPRLVELVQAAPNHVQFDGTLMYQVALDSLIQLQAVLSADDLLPIYQWFPDQVMILLAANPKENQAALLTIARDMNSSAENRPYWLAACNLLIETEAKGLAAHLLGEITIHLTIYVTDLEAHGGGSGGRFSLGCGGGRSPMPEGYPPIASYILKDEAKRGTVVIAPGPRMIYYERVIEQQLPLSADLGRSRHGWRKSDYALEYLAALLKSRVDDLEIEENPTDMIRWKDRADYLLMVKLQRASVADDFTRLKQRLQEKDLLSEKESEALPPKIEITIVDERRNKSIRLPEIPGAVKSQ